MRAIIDLEKLGERQIKIDCDVIRADGGTRTASITGAWVALSLALEELLQKGLITAMPLRDQVAAISCGMVNGQALADLDYNEDSSAETDANFVLTSSGGIVKFRHGRTTSFFRSPTPSNDGASKNRLPAAI